MFKAIVKVFDTEAPSTRNGDASIFETTVTADDLIELCDKVGGLLDAGVRPKPETRMREPF